MMQKPTTAHIKRCVRASLRFNTLTTITTSKNIVINLKMSHVLNKDGKKSYREMRET